MKPSTKTLRTLTAAAPLAFAALLAAAPQASAAIGGAVVDNPHVVDQGRALSVSFGTAVTDAATDNAIARNVANTFLGDWAGPLMQAAMQNAPQPASTCHMTMTATDPNGARGTVSGPVQSGVVANDLSIPDQAPGTKWGAGDMDHFAVEVTCADAERGTQMSKATIEQDQIVG